MVFVSQQMNYKCFVKTAAALTQRLNIVGAFRSTTTTRTFTMIKPWLIQNIQGFSMEEIPFSEKTPFDVFVYKKFQ